MVVFEVESGGRTRYLGVEEGNFHLDRGLRLVLRFLDEDMRLLDKDVFRLEGEDFHNWVAGSNGHTSLMQKIAAFAQVRLLSRVGS